jgi:hypothetical protein
MDFIHLKNVNQTYIEHFYDAMNFSFMSLRASFYFFIHAIWPDLFLTNGSKQIEKLHNIILSKTNKINKMI